MSVAANVTIPAQPAVGTTDLQPLGGNGVTAPHSCYIVRVVLVGDASGGSAIVGINGHLKYTNLCAWMNLRIQADTAAGEFSSTISQADGIAGPTIVGTIPGIAEASFTTNSTFLWYPPPLYFSGSGRWTAAYVNVDATETYELEAQIYCFDIDVLRKAPLPILQWNVPGVSAPAAI